MPRLYRKQKNMKRLFLLVATVSVLFVACNENEDTPYVPDTPNLPIAVESVTLNQTSASLIVGDTLRLVASVHPANATNDTVTWQSSDTTVAIVENGLITALWYGETTITVTTTDGEKTATSIVTVDFATGDQRPMFSMTDVLYAYPVPDQQFFLQGEHPYGFIRLTRNFGYLFSNANTTFEVRLTSETNEVSTASITWNTTNNTMTWTQPQFSNSTTYTLEIISTTNNEESVLLSYEFRTSMFNTFAEKMGQVEIPRASTFAQAGMGLVSIVWGTMASSEGFDQADLSGTEYSQSTPLIVVHSAMTDDFFLNTIYPLLYKNYPFDGFVTFSREPGQSIIPYWAILVNLSYNYGTTHIFPWLYALQRTYHLDFNDAQRQIRANPTAQATWGRLFNIPQLPLLPIREASYYLRFFYTLPNGLVTDDSVVKAFVLP